MASRSKHEAAILRQQLEVIAFLMETEGQLLKQTQPEIWAGYTAQSSSGGLPIKVGDFLVALAEALRQVAKQID